MRKLLLWFLLLLPLSAYAQHPPIKSRKWHPADIGQLSGSRWTHVQITGIVVFVKTEEDGDWHFRVRQTTGKQWCTCEIIPELEMNPPRAGDTVEVWGIRRIDSGHKVPEYPQGWPEVHPVIGWKKK